MCVVGSRRTDDSPTIGTGVCCVVVPKSTKKGFASLTSFLPKDAYVLASSDLRQALRNTLKQKWKWIVIDHANSAGVLSEILQNSNGASICYIAHNAEGIIRSEVASGEERALRRVIMKIDAWKYHHLERQVVSVADAIICITDADAGYFSAFHRNVHVIAPVYLGSTLISRTIGVDTPRRVMLIGSFEWVAKQRNLEEILNKIGPTLQSNGIFLDVVGAIPDSLKTRLSKNTSWATFHGQVRDISALATASRGGLVAEVFGGGFKLKILDYAFMRIPIFGLQRALIGMTEEEQRAMFTASNLGRLANVIVENIDKPDLLNTRQETLWGMVSRRFGVEQAISKIPMVFEAK